MSETAQRIDTHQHFWEYSPEQHGWMGPGLASLRRNYLPANLTPLMQRAGIDGTIAVQVRQTIEESEWLLSLAAQNPFIVGVVGWVDLRSPQVDGYLERLSQNPRFLGVRHIAQDEPDDEFLIRDDFMRGIAHLARFDLRYDLLIYPRQLPAACRLVERFPNQRFILDHISKPLVKEKRQEPWATDIRRLADSPNVACKISGMVTEADWKQWEPSDFTPYLDIVLESFGPQRLIVGSDWPVCTLAADYQAVIDLAEGYLSRLSSDEREAIWNGNVRKWYGV